MTDEYEEKQKGQEEKIGFWSSWRQLYLFIIAYAILQIILLYWFTKTFNLP